MYRLKRIFVERIEIICAVFFLILCILKFDFYFEGNELGGWDTVGHFQLAKVYATGLRNFDSLVWDDGWFAGFPAFYFYPPFFYLIVSVLFITLPIQFTTAFGLAIFFIIILLSYAIYRFFVVYLGSNIPKLYRILLSYSSIFFYLSYSGDGLQGTSLTGMWEGTFISNLGHGLLFLVLVDLEKYRLTSERRYIFKFILLSSLLICTHFLSSFFWLLATAIHIIFFQRYWMKNMRALFFALLSIFILSFPSWINYVLFQSYTSGVFYGFTYPPLLSILGKDVYDSALSLYGKGESFSIHYISLLIISGKILSILAVIAFLFETRKVINKTTNRSYVSILSIFFLWLSLDNTVGYIFPGVRIHNYRAFDTFSLGFSLLMVIGIYHLILKYRDKINVSWLLVFLFLFTFRNFIFFDPSTKEGLKSPYFHEIFPEAQRKDFANIEEELNKIPKGSLIFPEITRDRQYFSSPHFWSVFLRKYQLRNSLGLTVESSLFPTLLFNWEYAGLPNTFRWGTEIDWSNLFFSEISLENYESQLPAFFQRAGIEYAIGHSKEFRNFIYSRPKSFRILEESGPFLLVAVERTISIQSLPAGFVTDTWLRSQEKFAPGKFLRESNAVIANLYAHNVSLRIINMETNQIPLDKSLNEKFSLIFLYVNSGLTEESYALTKYFTDFSIPVVLLRASAPPNNALVWDWNPLIYDKIKGSLDKTTADSNNWYFSSTSYFPDLSDKNKNELFHSDSNQIALYKPLNKLELELPKWRSTLLTLVMILLPLGYFSLSLIKKTR